MHRLNHSLYLKSNRCFNNFLAMDYITANLSIDSIVLLLKTLTVVSTIFWPSIKANLSIDSIVHFIQNLTVVSTIFWPWLIANLSIDLIVHFVENLTVVSTIFLAIY